MILTICLVFLSFVPSASADEWTKSFNVERAAKVRIETSDANIRVTVWEGSTVTARVTTQMMTAERPRRMLHRNSKTITIAKNAPIRSASRTPPIDAVTRSAWSYQVSR